MTGTRHWYRGFGLTIDSTFAIPGAVPVTLGTGGIGRTGRPDIVIDAGCTAIGPVGDVSGPYSRSGDALLLDVPGVARYLAPSAAQLIIEPDADADPEDVSALLVATALPMLLWMRGGFVLHAAGVTMPSAREAIAIAGPSGVGKSTLAHRLVEGGASFVGDDSLLVSAGSGPPQVNGLAACCFLAAPGGAQREARCIPEPMQAETARLGAVIVLARPAPRTCRAPARLTGPAALEALLQNRHRPRVPAIMGRSAALLPISALLSRDVPIYRLEIPDNDAAEAHARLLSLVAAFGPE